MALDTINVGGRSERAIHDKAPGIETISLAEQTVANYVVNEQTAISFSYAFNKDEPRIAWVHEYNLSEGGICAF